MTVMNDGRRARRTTALVAGVVLLAGVAVLGGCSQLRTTSGYIADPTLTSAVRVGVDNKASVEQTLGRPSFVGQFTDNDWYYVSRNTSQLAFGNPRVTGETVLHITFDPAGNVVAVKRTGMEQIANITPDKHMTPVGGQHRSLLEQIFGNIGTVGAPGVGSDNPQGGSTGPSTDRTRPN